MRNWAQRLTKWLASMDSTFHGDVFLDKASLKYWMMREYREKMRGDHHPYVV